MIFLLLKIALTESERGEWNAEPDGTAKQDRD